MAGSQIRQIKFTPSGQSFSRKVFLRTSQNTKRRYKPEPSLVIKPSETQKTLLLASVANQREQLDVSKALSKSGQKRKSSLRRLKPCNTQQHDITQRSGMRTLYLDTTSQAKPEY